MWNLNYIFFSLSHTFPEVRFFLFGITYLGHHVNSVCLCAYVPSQTIWLMYCSMMFVCLFFRKRRVLVDDAVCYADNCILYFLSGLCLVKHESNFHYDAIGTNSGSKDYGIFQINSEFNCGRPSGTSTSICWRVNTYGCADSCTCKYNFIC